MYFYSYIIDYTNETSDREHEEGLIQSHEEKISVQLVLEHLNINKDDILYLCISRLT